jgi:hypothetical protein
LTIPFESYCAEYVTAAVSGLEEKLAYKIGKVLDTVSHNQETTGIE